MVCAGKDFGGSSAMLPMYYWLMPAMPWVVAMRLMMLMLPPPPTPQPSPGAEIIPFPARRLAAGRTASA